MKSGRIFWGTLFVVIGVLGVINNFFGVHVAWETLWKLWPLLLVFLGISLFLKDTAAKWAVIAAIGLLTGVVLFSSVQHGCHSAERMVEGVFDDTHVTDAFTQTLTEAFSESAGIASLHFEAGAGHFELNDTTSEYVRADISTNISGYTLSRTRGEEKDEFRLSMEERRLHLEGGKFRNRVAVYLNPEPLWDLNIASGAAKIDLDLRPFRVRTLSLEAGAASIDARLGSLSDTLHVHVETGASTIRLRVPDNVACEIVSDATMSSRTFSGFDKIDGNTYRSRDFDPAGKRMYIFVESALSKIVVKRYDASEW